MSNDSPQVIKPDATTSVEQKKETLAHPVRMASACNPIAMHQPHMAITKFTGENWTEFIEYFDSLAEANAWNDKDKLAILLMSIDSKPRMYARGDKGTPQTYEDVRRRLQQRYGQNEPAFNVRAQLREIQRHPGGEVGAVRRPFASGGTERTLGSARQGRVVLHRIPKRGT